jgi:hypothetical protein
MKSITRQPARTGVSLADHVAVPRKSIVFGAPVRTPLMKGEIQTG